MAASPAPSTDYSYSEANKKADITWGEDTFKDYIQNPMAKVPGTKMAFAGIKNEKEIDNLWAYLAAIQGRRQQEIADYSLNLRSSARPVGARNFFASQASWRRAIVANDGNGSRRSATICRHSAAMGRLPS